MKEIVLACDLGGTNLRMAAVSSDGKILHRLKVATPQAERANDVVQSIVDSARECREVIKKQGNVKAIAAAVPATINHEKEIILKAPNVPALNNFSIAAALENELDLPCLLENDANAAAIGENWLGASKGLNSSICVTLGTGVGGGIIVDGKILRGADGTAGEIGHICVEPFGAWCGCGSRGCVEQYSSATAIVRLAREFAAQYPQSELNKKLHLSSLEIYQAGKNSDELAVEVFRRQGFYLGIALADLINILNPEIIVIGGGAAAGWDLFMPKTIEEITKRAYEEPAERAKLVPAECGDDAGILGVARLGFEKVSRAN